MDHALYNGRDWTLEPDRTVHVDGATLRYLVHGSGEPIVCIHGTSLADSLINPLQMYPDLFERFQIISYYRAGYNGSTFDGEGVSIEQGADHVIQLMDHIGIPKAHMLAFSFGGVIGFQALLSHPNRFQSAVLLEPYLPRESMKAIQANTEAYMAAMALYQAGDKLGAGLLYMEAVCGPDFLSAVQMTGPLDVWERAAAAMTTTFEVDFPAVSIWPFRMSLADTFAPQKPEMPVLAVMGLQSEAAMPGFREVQDFLMRWLPQAERCGIPFATHGLQSMNPKAVGEAATNFFRKHPI